MEAKAHEAHAFSKYNSIQQTQVIFSSPHKSRTVPQDVAATKTVNGFKELENSKANFSSRILSTNV